MCSAKRCESGEAVSAGAYVSKGTSSNLVSSWKFSLQVRGALALTFRIVFSNPCDLQEDENAQVEMSAVFYMATPKLNCFDFPGFIFADFRCPGEFSRAEKSVRISRLISLDMRDSCLRDEIISRKSEHKTRVEYSALQT